MSKYLTEEEQRQLLSKYPLELGCEPAIIVAVDRIKGLLLEETQLTQAREDIRVLRSALELIHSQATACILSTEEEGDMSANWVHKRALEALLKTQRKEGGGLE